jgi:hypothetical protein
MFSRSGSIQRPISELWMFCGSTKLRPAILGNSANDRFSCATKLCHPEHQFSRLRQLRRASAQLDAGYNRVEAQRRLGLTRRVTMRLLNRPIAWLENQYGTNRLPLFAEKQLDEIRDAIANGTIKVQARSLRGPKRGVCLAEPRHTLASERTTETDLIANDDCKPAELVQHRDLAALGLIQTWRATKSNPIAHQLGNADLTSELSLPTLCQRYGVLQPNPFAPRPTQFVAPRGQSVAPKDQFVPWTTVFVQQTTRSDLPKAAFAFQRQMGRQLRGVVFLDSRSFGFFHMVVNCSRSKFFRHIGRQPWVASLSEYPDSVPRRNVPPQFRISGWRVNLKDFNNSFNICYFLLYFS